MNGIKYKYILFTPFLIILFGISLTIINLIRETLIFDPKRNYVSNGINFSYEIISTDNKIISKLSRKFDITDNKNSIPILLKYGFISSEDKRFLDHNGIDLIGLTRAFLSNLRSGYIKEGGSTITQQVARLIFLNNDLNFKRKFKELIISLILDLKFSKNQILKIYLNNIYLGSGAYGVNEASEVYFGKLINELTLSEIALIIGLAPAPSIYSPYENLDLAIEKRNTILESMHNDGYISFAEKSAAIKEKLELNSYQNNKSIKDKLLVEFILEETSQKIKLDQKNKFLRIKSSINKNWQDKAQELSEAVGPNNIEVALLSIESNTGLIRALISGKNPTTNEFNRVTSAIRPLGSTFKIIPYAAALLDGIKLSDKFEDIPTCWGNYCPNNFSDNYRGKISLIESFKSSSNIVPLKITKNIGLKKIINLANLFGLGYKQKIEEFMPLAIGSYGDNLLNITNAYAVINSNGNIYKPSTIEKIESINGQLIWENKFLYKKILDAKVNKEINKLLEKSVSEGTSIAASIKGEKIYGKTGTSDENRDLWFIGSINNLTTGVWIGFDENKPSNLSSGNAAYFWKTFISNIYDFRIEQ